MMTKIDSYGDLYEYGKQSLREAGVPETDLDARLLLEAVCNTRYNDLLMHRDMAVSVEQRTRYEELLWKRAQRIPLQQLLGTACFMGLDFTVDENVLIPRADTEILVEEVLKNLHEGMRVLDLCTGSGCILLSLLHYSNEVTGVGIDLSPEALQIAECNRRNLLGDATDRVQFLQGDLFVPLTENQKFEIVVSNPPYIATAAIDDLEPEVRDHEPRMALDGFADGLYFYRKIIEGAPAVLCGGGQLFFEIGFDQGEAVSNMMKEKGFLEVAVLKDYAGLDRVVYGTLPSL